ncbi:MAG: methylase [Oscillospiraceae bacterium]|nr:methylase [Oscillospiraceae bacterium]
MTDKEQRAAAEKFAADWKDKGYEKGQSQAFWLSLLRDVYGVTHPEQFILFEEKVHLDNTSFIDATIPATKVLIEQKGIGKDLMKPIRQSDGTLLTPFQQAKRYITELPLSQHPRWVVTCNFSTFNVYDMERPGGEPEEILLENLPKEYFRLSFLTDTGSEVLKREMEVSIVAGKIVGLLYDAFSSQYVDFNNEHSHTSLNMLCVRLVFCLYAEDSGIFGRHGMFHDYLKQHETRYLRKAIMDLFEVLDTLPDDRDPYLDPTLAAFPYVNGELFAREDIEIPLFTDEIRDLLLYRASEDFNWAEISPTIFGAVFESTLNPETRRSGGMHYTSIENIHKVIDPLFLDGLKVEFETICDINVEKTKMSKLRELQKKLSSLTFLDPACGSGNFLTETYICLRHLENEILSRLQKEQIIFGDAQYNPIEVSIGQFYGIEINDFAVTVARTALWIAENQMLKETESIVNMQLDYLPLKSYANIAEGNALRMDWDSVIPKHNTSYIMGNPPFVGYSNQNAAQKADMLSVYVDDKGKPFKTAGKIDYVAGWYYKAAQFLAGTGIRAAFVSTNSITQGEQVVSVWKPLYDMFGIHIDFAHRTFKWSSEASDKAAVHCVIVGFSAGLAGEKMLYSGERKRVVQRINPYLFEAPDVFVESRRTPISDVPMMITGNRPADGGHLIIEDADLADFIKADPKSEKYIRRFMGSAEFINNRLRWCLWLVDVPASELRQMPEVMKRIAACKQDRENAPDAGRRKLADSPALFREQHSSVVDYIVVPKVSSENRRYVPIGYVPADTIASDLLFLVLNSELYHYGILTSNVHMAWMRAVCGRLKSDYRYSRDIVYNTFPWPDVSDEQKTGIEALAQAVLDVREKEHGSLADLYDPIAMPPVLMNAHRDLDRAVMELYGFSVKDMDEAACVAALMERYKIMTGGKGE